MNTKSIVYTAVLSALLCALSPIMIPIGPVPMTLATLIIYIIGTVFDIKISLTSVIIYISLGCLGLPVFSGFSGGIGVLFGPTGGYILGYLPMVLCITMMNKCRFKPIFSMITGAAVLLFVGIIWYVFVTKVDLITAFSICILPFLPGEMLKIFPASVIIPKIRLNLHKN